MSRGILTAMSVFAVGILIVVAGFFLLDIEKIDLNFWAFGSLLFSLMVSSLVMISVIAPKKNNDGVFHTAGLSSAVLIYEVVVAVSVLFTQSFINRLGHFIFLQITINALLIIAVVVISSASGHIHDHNEDACENLQKGEYNKPKRGGF